MPGSGGGGAPIPVEHERVSRVDLSPIKPIGDRMASYLSRESRIYVYLSAVHRRPLVRWGGRFGWAERMRVHNLSFKAKSHACIIWGFELGRVVRNSR